MDQHPLTPLLAPRSLIVLTQPEGQRSPQAQRLLAALKAQRYLGELAVADELYKADMERTAFYRKADVEKWQAGYSLIDKAAADYNQASARFRATPILLEGQNTATALRTNSYGSLISGVSDAARIGLNYNFKGR